MRHTKKCENKYSSWKYTAREVLIHSETVTGMGPGMTLTYKKNLKREICYPYSTWKKFCQLSLQELFQGFTWKNFWTNFWDCSMMWHTLLRHKTEFKCHFHKTIWIKIFGLFKKTLAYNLVSLETVMQLAIFRPD